MINYIKSIMVEAESKNIKINCFVSDSAGEYAAAWYVLNFFNILLLLNNTILKKIKIYIYLFSLEKLCMWNIQIRFFYLVWLIR